jgi:hypothetical protein
VLTSTGPVNVGGTTLAAGNASAYVLLLSHGRMNLAAPINAGTVWPGAGIQVAGGELDINGLLTVRGTLRMNAGDVIGGAIVLKGDGLITGEGKVASSIFAGTDTTVSIVADGGPLSLGSDAAGVDVVLRGHLDIGSESVTIVDPDTAVVGNISIGGGDLYLPIGVGLLEAGQRIVGDGIIHGSLISHGILVADGAPLQFGGTLYGTGQGAGGNLFQFLDGGGFEGTGTIAAKVLGEPGSVIRATGPLTLGNPVLPGSVIIGGRLESVGPYLLTLRSLNGIDINGVLSLNRTIVTSAFQTININSGGRLEGTGTVSSLLSLRGTIAPGNSAGKLTLSGLSMTNGRYEADLGRHATAEGDTVSVNKVATISGTLALHRLLTCSAAPGDSFKVLECDSLSGTFSTVTLDGAPLAGEFVIAYSNKGVWAIAQQTILDAGGGHPGTPQSLRFAPIGSPGSRPGVELALPEATRVRITVFDLQGREVARAYDGALAAGTHRFDVARDLGGAGIYFVRAVVGEGRRDVRTARIVRTR